MSTSPVAIRLARHALALRFFRKLSEGDATRGPYGTETLGAVTERAGQDDADRLVAIEFGERLKQCVDLHGEIALRARPHAQVSVDDRDLGVRRDDIDMTDSTRIPSVAVSTRSAVRVARISRSWLS